jgi:hypothetical protein
LRVHACPSPSSSDHSRFFHNIQLFNNEWRHAIWGILLLVLIAWVALRTHHCLVMLLLLPLRLHVRSDLLVCGGSNSNATCTCKQFAIYAGRAHHTISCVKEPFRISGLHHPKYDIKLTKSNIQGIILLT